MSRWVTAMALVGLASFGCGGEADGSGPGDASVSRDSGPDEAIDGASDGDGGGVPVPACSIGGRYALPAAGATGVHLTRLPEPALAWSRRDAEGRWATFVQLDDVHGGTTPVLLGEGQLIGLEGTGEAPPVALLRGTGTLALVEVKRDGSAGLATTLPDRGGDPVLIVGDTVRALAWPTGGNTEVTVVETSTVPASTYTVTGEARSAATRGPWLVTSEGSRLHLLRLGEEDGATVEDTTVDLSGPPVAVSLADALYGGDPAEWLAIAARDASGGITLTLDATDPAVFELGDVTVEHETAAATTGHTGALLQLGHGDGTATLRLLSDGFGGEADLVIEAGLASEERAALVGFDDTFPTFLVAWPAEDEIVVQRVTCARPF